MDAQHSPQSYQPTPEQQVTVNGIRLAYDSFGDPNDRPLLLIAGLGAQLVTWDVGFCSQLVDEGYYVIRYDNRDVGHSTWFDEAGLPDFDLLMASYLQGQSITAPVVYDLGDMAADAVGLLDTLGLDSAHVLGVSMGGMIAQIMALRYPQYLRTLTCLSTSTADPALPPPAPEAIAALVTPPPPGREAYIERAIAGSRVLHGNERPFDEAYSRRRAAMFYDRGLHPAGTMRHLAAIAASVGWREELPAVITPTLVIHGSADPLLPLPCGEDVAHMIPNARLHVIPGAGHTFPPQYWSETVALLREHAV